MNFKIKNIFYFLLISEMFSCSNAMNYKDAYLQIIEDKVYIKLKGRRTPHPSGFGSLLSGETYEDSVLIPIPEFKNEIIDGKEIPVSQGRCRFSGNIIINANHLSVNLILNNTDDKKSQPYCWNGEYNLIK
jgi:hypothetical protein